MLEAVAAALEGEKTRNRRVSGGTVLPADHFVALVHVHEKRQPGIEVDGGLQLLQAGAVLLRPLVLFESNVIDLRSQQHVAVQTEVEGDTQFPEIELDEWEVVAVDEYPAGDDREIGFEIETLERR